MRRSHSSRLLRPLVAPPTPTHLTHLRWETRLAPFFCVVVTYGEPMTVPATPAAPITLTSAVLVLPSLVPVALGRAGKKAIVGLAAAEARRVVLKMLPPDNDDDDGSIDNEDEELPEGCSAALAAAGIEQLHFPTLMQPIRLVLVGDPADLAGVAAHVTGYLSPSTEVGNNEEDEEVDGDGCTVGTAGASKEVRDSKLFFGASGDAEP